MTSSAPFSSISSAIPALHELLCPHLLDVASQYDEQFVGMTVEPVALDTLYDARERLVDAIAAHAAHAAHAPVREFLLRFHAIDPDLAAIGLAAELVELPAVRWKLQNLERLRTENPTKFDRQLTDLAACLE